jgi:predicted PurR-regulated permease PerM
MATRKEITTVRGYITYGFVVAVALGVAWEVRDVLLLIYVSGLLSIVLMPPVRGIMRLKFGKWQPDRTSAILILLGCLAIICGVLFFFALPPLLKDTESFATGFPKHLSELEDKSRALPIMRHLNVNMINERIGAAAGSTATWVISSAEIWAHAAFSLIMGVILTLYFMIEGERVYMWLLSLVPAAHRARLLGTLLRAQVKMDKWLLGQGLLMLIMMVVSMIVYESLHLRYAFALAVLMGLFNIVPVVGAIVTVTLSLLVAAVDSWGKVAGVAIFYAIYVQIENGYLTPRIMMSRLDISGVAVLVALLIGAKLAGIVGAIVAVPTAVLVTVLAEEYLMRVPPDQVHEEYLLETAAAEED